VRRTDSPRFSLVGLTVALLTVGVGTAAGLAFVPTVGTYVGMLAGGFVAGLAVEARPTTESGVAAAVASVGVLVAGALPGSGVVDAVLSVAAVDPVTLLVSVALAFAVGAFGGHFGDDLRDGLTESLPRSSPAPDSQRPVSDQSATTRADALSSPVDERTDQQDGIDTADGIEGHGGTETGENADAEGESVDREHAEFELEE
jgi:hypothetical protein